MVNVELERKTQPSGFQRLLGGFAGAPTRACCGDGHGYQQSLGKVLIGLDRVDLGRVQQVAAGHFFANEHPFVFVISFDYLAAGSLRQCAVGGQALGSLYRPTGSGLFISN